MEELSMFFFPKTMEKNEMSHLTAFRDLISGRRRGAVAAIERFGLRLVEVPYTSVIAWRNRRYDRGRAKVHRAGVPVVSVGNITLGGTGKTPMVAWLARWFRRRGVGVTIISRGYGAHLSGRNDEARELEQQLPDVPHLQNPDRVAAARVAVEELDAQLILLDDGFQHRRIARDLEIVLLDALEPFGYEHVFPRGTLREPLSGLRRADVILLSRAETLSPAEREAIRLRVTNIAPKILWAEIRHAPQDLLSATGERLPWESLRSGPIAAFCGLGNPRGFRHTLQECGCELAGFREFPDHHPYRRADLEELARWAEGLNAAAIICSQKDLVKIGLSQLGGKPLWALRIAVEFLAGQKSFEERLRFLGQSVSSQ
jgi:tetraacyldisaccharide 4'-kinase